VQTLIKNLNFLVRLRNSDPTTAPQVPKSIKKTAAIDISMSVKPKGLIKKLALEANV
jgi:hypothetical protein